MRRGWIVALTATVLIGLAVTERWLAPRVVGRRLATADARWIWAPPGARGVVPQAFQAARDFELTRVPAAAEVLIQGDEEYVLYLNGARLGGNRYRPGAPLDRYPVAPLLRAGNNRLLVKLSSERRAGGLLLRLTGGDGLEVVTDRDWEILLRNRSRHLDPARELTQSWPPRVWGRPPTGRWRLPEVGPSLPLHAELVTDRRRRPRRFLAGGRWLAMARFDEAAPAPGEPLTFDFGRQRVGYPWLDFDGRRVPRALLYFGVEAPADLEFEAPAAAVVAPPGRPRWIDALPRRLRYLTVVSVTPPRRVFLVPADPERVAPLLAQQAPLPGVFGVDEPPPLVTPVEYELRRQLQRLAGRADR